MPTPDQQRVAMSLTIADHDIEAAETLVSAAPHLYENIGFHCQQAVEKYVKAVLVSSGLPVQFIHNLVTLMGPPQRASVVKFTQQDFADAATLNEFAVEFRYETDDAPSYTSADLLVMAHNFRSKRHPLALAFLT